MPRNRLEDTHQAAFFEWVALQWVTVNGERLPLRKLAFHCPNERTEPAQRKRLSRLGVLPGVSDICVPVPVIDERDQLWCGLWIELKVGENKPTESQSTFLRNMRWLGYQARVCWGSGAAIDTTINYLGDLLNAHTRVHVQTKSVRRCRDIFSD